MHGAFAAFRLGREILRMRAILDGQPVPPEAAAVAHRALDRHTFRNRPRASRGQVKHASGQLLLTYRIWRHEAVDLVLLFGEDTPLDVITALLPDVLVKGADYRPDQVVGADVVQAHGGHIEIVARERVGAMVSIHLPREMALNPDVLECLPADETAAPLRAR